MNRCKNRDSLLKHKLRSLNDSSCISADDTFQHNSRVSTREVRLRRHQRKNRRHLTKLT